MTPRAVRSINLYDAHLLYFYLPFARCPPLFISYSLPDLSPTYTGDGLYYSILFPYLPGWTRTPLVADVQLSIPSTCRFDDGGRMVDDLQMVSILAHFDILRSLV